MREIELTHLVKRLESNTLKESKSKREVKIVTKIRKYDQIVFESPVSLHWGYKSHESYFILYITSRWDVAKFGERNLLHKPSLGKLWRNTHTHLVFPRANAPSRFPISSAITDKYAKHTLLLSVRINPDSFLVFLCGIGRLAWHSDSVYRNLKVDK